MTKPKSHHPLSGIDTSFGAPQNCSYFEEVCRRAETDQSKISRDHFCKLRDEMVNALNEQKEKDKMSTLSMYNHGGLLGGYTDKPLAVTQVDIDIDDDNVYVVSNGNGMIVGGGASAGSVNVSANSINNMVGTLTAGTLPVGTGFGSGALNGQYTYASNLQKISLIGPISENPNLPTIDFQSFDDAGKPIKMTLKPEGTVTAYESLLLCMLIQSAIQNQTAFSTFLFVRKNNLEKHFKYTS